MHTKNINVLQASVVTLALFSGCFPLSHQGVLSVPGSEVDPTPYLGSWIPQSVGAVTVSDNTPGIVAMEPDSSLSLIYDIGEASETDSLSLTQVGGRTVLSHFDQFGTVGIFSLQLDVSGDTLSLFPLNADSLFQHINGSLIDGTVDLSVQPGIIRVEATSGELRTYLLAHPDVFLLTNPIVFAHP